MDGWILLYLLCGLALGLSIASTSILNKLVHAHASLTNGETVSGNLWTEVFMSAFCIAGILYLLITQWGQ